MTIEQENALLLAGIKLLENTLQSQQKSIREKDAELNKKDAELAYQADIIQRLRQLHFGQKRERFEQADNQLDLFEPVDEQIKEDLQQ